MRARELFGTRSLRFAIAFCLGIGAINLTAFTWVFLEVAREEINRVGAILASEARLNADASEARLRAALEARQMSEIRRIDYLALFNARGVAELGNFPDMPAVPVDGRPHRLDAAAMSKLGALRVATIVVAVRRSDGGVLLLGRSLEDAHESEETLWRALALALLPMIALYLVLGVFFARSAVRRLESAHKSITRIMAGDFAVRLPVSRENDEIDRVARAVNLMLDEIARLLEQLKNVGDNVAHELRAPLAVARAKLERALEGDCGGEKARVTAALEELERAGRMIAAMLRIADVENGLRESRFRDVDLAEICAQTQEFFGPLAEAKGVAMSVEAAPIVVRGDEDLLREAVFNLVDNAIKFTPPGGAVALCVTGAPDRPRLEVRDTGPGVAPADAEKIFQRFYRAPSARGKQGYGLGLGIARAIARLHGFDLRVEPSRLGALFVIG